MNNSITDQPDVGESEALLALSHCPVGLHYLPLQPEGLTATGNKRPRHVQYDPREIVHELDSHIIGQDAAKRAVAIALRNRWRRMQLREELRNEVTPKNILMIGPTGVGKTEIARRLARLADAPFVKVEATKFTEVGYVGKDVESIIRDLVETSVKQLREQEMQKVQHRAMDAAEERILDVLLPPARDKEQTETESGTRQVFRKKLRQGELDDREIEIEVNASPVGVEIMAPPGMEEMTNQLQKHVFQPWKKQNQSAKDDRGTGHEKTHRGRSGKTGQ